MKKCLMILLLLILAGCSSKEVVEDEGKVIDNGQVGENPSTNEEVAQPEAKSTDDDIARVLQEIRDNYGFLADQRGFYENKSWESGFVHGQIVDFDLDGTDELAVLYKSSIYADTPLKHRATTDYVFEVWGQSGEDFQMLFNQVIPIDECSACDLSVGIIQYNVGNYGIVVSKTQVAEAVTYTTETHYFMTSQGKFETALFESEVGVDHGVFRFNGEERERELFDSDLMLYEGDMQFWIESHAGTKQFAINRDSSGATFNSLLSEVQEQAITGKEVDSFDMYLPAQRILYVSYVDIHDKKSLRPMIEQVALYEDLQADFGVKENFGALTEKQVAEQFEKLYGIPMDLSGAELTGFHEGEIDLVTYEDGMFYVFNEEFPNPRIIRTVEKAWEIANNTYYLILNDTVFEEQSYYNVSDVSYAEIEAMVEKPVESWPEQARKYAYSNVYRYMVIHLDGDQTIVRYLKFDPLTNEKLMEFK